MPINPSFRVQQSERVAFKRPPSDGALLRLLGYGELAFVSNFFSAFFPLHVLPQCRYHLRACSFALHIKKQWAANAVGNYESTHTFSRVRRNYNNQQAIMRIIKGLIKTWVS